MREGKTRSAGVSLLFARGDRPTQDDVVRVLATLSDTGLTAQVSHRPSGQADWLELLVSGLTFDLIGLAPSEGADVEPPLHLYGFETGLSLELEAITIVPSGHIAAAASLEPVVRGIAGLAANLALHLPVSAVLWHSAGTAMEPRYFSRAVLNWLAGGAFPALGLTALVVATDGSLSTTGLSHFTGQELQLEGSPGEAQTDTVKLAIRLVDHFVQGGRLTAPQTIEVGGMKLLAEPSAGGPLVLVWRET